MLLERPGAITWDDYEKIERVLDTQLEGLPSYADDARGQPESNASLRLPFGSSELSFNPHLFRVELILLATEIGYKGIKADAFGDNDHRQRRTNAARKMATTMRAVTELDLISPHVYVGVSTH